MILTVHGGLVQNAGLHFFFLSFLVEIDYSTISIFFCIWDCILELGSLCNVRFEIHSCG